MKDRSYDTSHHERTLLPRSYISLPTQIMREETCCHHFMDYTFQPAARDLLYTTSCSLYYTSCGALARIKPSSMELQRGIDLMVHHTLSKHSTIDLQLAKKKEKNDTPKKKPKQKKKGRKNDTPLPPPPKKRRKKENTPLKNPPKKEKTPQKKKKKDTRPPPPLKKTHQQTKKQKCTTQTR